MLQGPYTEHFAVTVYAHNEADMLGIARRLRTKCKRGDVAIQTRSVYRVYASVGRFDLDSVLQQIVVVDGGRNDLSQHRGQVSRFVRLYDRSGYLIADA